MTGGTGMYIHNYQIHNVLNAYRKQLSQNPVKGSTKKPSPASGSPKDMVTLSGQGKQPSIVNKISAEIVNRITQFGPQSQFEDALARQLSEPPSDRPVETEYRGIEFAYTLIDEQNRKTTHKLPIRELDALDKAAVNQGQSPLDGTERQKQSAKELLENNPKLELERKG